MSTSALVWLVWSIFGFLGVLGAFSMLEISAFKRGQKLDLTTLSETIWAAERRYPFLRKLVAAGCALISLSFAFLIVHFYAEFP